ncbi:MAG: VCBS repeat-containing protein [bacterium]|nr:VCBS repeat-containing protein [bacterium]
MNPSIRFVSALLLASTIVHAQSVFRETRFATVPNNLRPARVDAGDVDGDGDLDLIVANDFQPVQVFINDGNGTFTDGTAGRFVTPAGVDNTDIDLADIDGDGDLDALMTNEDGVTNYVFTNTGMGVFTLAPTALPPQANDTKNQVLADFDRDGDIDCLAVDTGGCHFYENNGAGQFSDQTATRLSGVPLGLGSEYAEAPRAADIDGNGELDVLLPGAGGLLFNTGGVLAPAPNQLPIIAQAPHWLADFDGDGDIDIFASSGRRIYENVGGGSFIDATPWTIPPAPQAGYGLIDVDRDGDLDILRTNRTDLNNGNGTFTTAPAPAAVPLPQRYGFQVGHLAADYDGDGDEDMVGLSNLLHHIDAPTAPQIGSTYSVELHVRPGSIAPGLVVAALGAGTLPLGPYPSLRLDPATAVVVAFSPAIATPLTFNSAIPNAPGLVGVNLHYQGMHIDPVVGVVATNTFRDTVQ